MLRLDSQPETAVLGHFCFMVFCKQKWTWGTICSTQLRFNPITTGFFSDLFSVLCHTSLTNMNYQSGLRKNNGDVNVQVNKAARITNSLTTLSTWLSDLVKLTDFKNIIAALEFLLFYRISVDFLFVCLTHSNAAPVEDTNLLSWSKFDATITTLFSYRATCYI